MIEAEDPKGATSWDQHWCRDEDTHVGITAGRGVRTKGSQGSTAWSQASGRDENTCLRKCGNQRQGHSCGSGASPKCATYWLPDLGAGGLTFSFVK